MINKRGFQVFQSGIGAHPKVCLTPIVFWSYTFSGNGLCQSRRKTSKGQAGSIRRKVPCQGGRLGSELAIVVHEFTFAADDFPEERHHAFWFARPTGPFQEQLEFGSNKDCSESFSATRAPRQAISSFAPSLKYMQ
jgi:hypothetical protein